MQEYDVALKLLLQGSARLTIRELAGGPVVKWLDMELPKVQNLRMDLLGVAMGELNDREREILTERRLKDNPSTLEDLAERFGVSRERVRQIEVRAFEKLQKAMVTAGQAA